MQDKVRTVAEKIFDPARTAWMRPDSPAACLRLGLQDGPDTLVRIDAGRIAAALAADDARGPDDRDDTGDADNGGETAVVEADEESDEVVEVEAGADHSETADDPEEPAHADVSGDSDGTDGLDSTYAPDPSDVPMLLERICARPDADLSGTIDLGVRAPEGGDLTLPPPTVVDGHLVTPLLDPGDRTLLLDLDESRFPVTMAWDPLPTDVRLTPQREGGYELAVDLPFFASTATHMMSQPTALDEPRRFAATAADAMADETEPAYRVELVLAGTEHRSAVPAALWSGPGTIGVLRAHIPTERLTPGHAYVLMIHTGRGTSRLGIDLDVPVEPNMAPVPRRSVKVSVLVAARNAGAYLGDCLGSALGQSMPREDYEVIVADDGSTDGTAGLLDWLSTLHPHLRVAEPTVVDEQGPWNAGLAAARGEYVYPLPATDRLAPTALDELYDYAAGFGGDVVLGRTVGVGVAVPRGPYRRSKPIATLSDTPLVDSLTPNKLFRKAFLDRHRLTFEFDHALSEQRFVAETYLIADRISVYADQICHYRVDRGPIDPPRHAPSAAAAADGSPGRSSPERLVDGLRDTLALVEKYLGQGPELDRFRRRWYRSEVLHRLRGATLLELPRSMRIEWFERLREFAAEHLDPSLSSELAPPDRVVAGLLSTGHLDVTERLARWEESVELAVDTEQIQWHGSTLRLRLRAALHADGEPLFAATGDAALLDPPLSAVGWTALVGSLGTDPVDATSELLRARLVLVCRNEDDDTVRIIPTRTIPDTPDAVSLAEDGHLVSVEVPTRGLEPGDWHLSARLRCAGWLRCRDLTADVDVLADQRPGHRVAVPVVDVAAPSHDVAELVADGGPEAEHADAVAAVGGMFDPHAPLLLRVAGDESLPVVIRRNEPSPEVPWWRRWLRVIRDTMG